MIHILKQRLAYIVLFMVVIIGMTHGIARGEDIALANLPEIIRNAADKAILNDIMPIMITLPIIFE